MRKGKTNSISIEELHKECEEKESLIRILITHPRSE
jgi:hypothetical protein